MKLKKSSIREIIGKLLIYFLIIMNYSQIYYVYLDDYQFIIFILLISVSVFWAIALKEQNYIMRYCLFFLLFLLFSTVMLRYTVGGIGLKELMSISNQILIVAIAIVYNKEFFLNRFIQVVTFLSIASLVGFFLGFISPNLLRSFLMIQYTSAWGMPANGLLFYTYIPEFADRNSGFFSEPGLYQCVLNSALYILLFWPNKLKLQGRKYIVTIIIIIATIITAQSTTGYLSLVAIGITWLFTKNIPQRYKRNALIAIALGVIYLVIENTLYSENNLLVKVIGNKMFDDTGRFTLEEGTGIFRINTIEKAWKMFLQNPWGMGYDELASGINSYGTGLVAGVLIKTLAAWGFFPFTVMIIWLIRPFFKAKQSIAAIVAFVFIYINVTISQTSMFYTSIIMIPLYLYYCFFREINLQRK